MSARCMGGWCLMRAGCAAYAGPVGPADTIHERICVRGRDGERDPDIDGRTIVLSGPGWQLTRAEISTAARVEARSASDAPAVMGW